jgi:hypothetical protein
MLVVPMLLWWRRGVRRISHVEQSRPRFVFLAFWTPLGYLAGLTGFVGPLFFVIGVAAVVNDGVDPASFQVLALASMLIAVAVAVLWLCRWQSQRVLDKWPPPQVAVPHTKRAAAR